MSKSAVSKFQAGVAEIAAPSNGLEIARSKSLFDIDT